MAEDAGIKAPRWRRWGKEALWLLLMALVITTLVDLWRSPTLPAGAMEAPFTLQDGTTTTLAEQSRGKPLLVYYWASWCGVCRFTTPTVEQLWQEGENVLTVALRSGDNAALETWLARKKLTLPTVNDPSGQLARQWDIRVTPTLVVIYRGEVKSVTTGWTSSWGMRLRLWLASW